MPYAAAGPRAHKPQDTNNTKALRNRDLNRLAFHSDQVLPCMCCALPGHPGTKEHGNCARLVQQAWPAASACISSLLTELLCCALPLHVAALLCSNMPQAHT